MSIADAYQGAVADLRTLDQEGTDFLETAASSQSGSSKHSLRTPLSSTSRLVHGVRHVKFSYCTAAIPTAEEVFSGSTDCLRAFSRCLVQRPFQTGLSLSPDSLLSGRTPVRGTAAAGARVSLTRKGGG
jgi:hypothetical protein